MLQKVQSCESDLTKCLLLDPPCIMYRHPNGLHIAFTLALFLVKGTLQVTMDMTTHCCAVPESLSTT